MRRQPVSRDLAKKYSIFTEDRLPLLASRHTGSLQSNGLGHLGEPKTPLRKHSIVDQPQFDVVAVGAHPDDVEIGCGGTLARLADEGYRVGIIDLTNGEPTPGCPSPEVRVAEARQAADILGVEKRVTLGLPNRRLFDDFQARVALAKEFRRLRPRLVLAVGDGTPTASPDHYQAKMITEAAIFYSKLTKWDAHFEGLPPYRIPVFLHYFMAYHSLSPPALGSVVLDISQTLEKKIAAVTAYRSQFPPEKAEVLERVRIFNRQQGMAAGFAAGEVLHHPGTLGTRDLMGMLFGGE